MKKLAGKVAIVTGASKGIGAAIAESMGAEGASVIVNYARSATDAARVVSAITKAGGTATAVQGDVSKAADIERLFAAAKKHYGRLDILVNNAGVYEFAPLEVVTEELFHRMFNLNVLGLLLCSREALKYFGPEGGSIVNISSIAGIIAPALGSVYSASKAAVDAVTRSLAKELGPRRIRVNSINPGMVETEGVRSAGISESEFRKEIEKQTPLGRIGQPQDIAPAAVYLASAEASWVTGESLVITGGYR